MTSRHHTYRQASTLILSPSIQSINPSSRTSEGTTVTIKDLFADFPVRQSSSRSNSQSEWTELHRITVAVALTKVSLTLRNAGGDKLVKIDAVGKDWERGVLEKGITCNISAFTMLEGQLDNVSVSIKFCQASCPRNYSFICTSLVETKLDVNGDYIHAHSLLTDIKSSLSKFLVSRGTKPDSQNFNSSIIILRVRSTPQSSVSLAQTITTILSGLSGSRDCVEGVRVSLIDTPQIESKIKSAKGIEYSKITRGMGKKVKVSVGVEEPGVEFNQRVVSLGTNNSLLARDQECRFPQIKCTPCHGECGNYSISTSGRRNNPTANVCRCRC
jgi:hypothetical protein